MEYENNIKRDIRIWLGHSTDVASETTRESYGFRVVSDSGVIASGSLPMSLLKPQGLIAT